VQLASFSEGLPKVVQFISYSVNYFVGTQRVTAVLEVAMNQEVIWHDII